MSDAYHQWKLLHPAFETVTVEEAFEAGAAVADARYAEGKEEGADEGFDEGKEAAEIECGKELAVENEKWVAEVQVVMDAIDSGDATIESVYKMLEKLV